MTSLASLVFFADNLAATAAFYRALGIDLEDEDHGDGPVHAAAEVGGVHIAVYQAEAGGSRAAPPFRAAASTFPGVYVPSLDDTTAALAGLGAPILQTHQERPWGCRIVATDPDGRAVEVNQRGHCP